MAQDDLADERSEDSGSDDRSAGKSTEPKVDYFKKYTGMQKKFDEERQAKLQLQSRLDDISLKHEDDLSTLRVESAGKEKRVKELEALYNAEKVQREHLNEEVTRQKTRTATRIQLKDSHPALLDLYDSEDLKELHHFDNDEAKYKEYLDRMSQYVATPEPDDKQKRHLGATPSAAPRVRDEGKGKQTLDTLSAELAALDPRDPDKKRKQEQILAQMDRL